jgi:hypothetical protein
MSVRSAQSVTVLFATSNAATGAAADATGTPTGTLYLNGTANAAAVTVTNITTGVYKAAVTMPTLAAGDIVSLRIAATVATIAAEGVVWQDTADVVLDASGYVKISGTKNTLDDLNDITAQQVRDAMKLAPTAGAGAAGSVDVHLDDILEDTGTTLPASIAAIDCTVALSATQAASVATGALAIRTHHTLAQALTSTSTAALNTATKLWLVIKSNRADTDAQAVVFIEAAAGLTVLAGAPYITVAHGTLVVTGNAGAWTVTVGMDKVATGLLTDYAEAMLWAECKALVAGSTVAVWDGVCDVSRGIVVAVA